MREIRSNVVKTTRPYCICANERVKMTGAIDGFFPDMGSHIEREMGGLWIPPIKLLDGFWLKLDGAGEKDFREAKQRMGVMDYESEISEKEEWLVADSFEGFPWKNKFYCGGKGKNRGISVIRTDLAPDDICGVIITYEVYNERKEEADLCLTFLARANLRAEWLGERNGMKDGADKAEYDPEEKRFHVYDTENPWHMLLGTDGEVEQVRSGQFFGPEVNVGAGISCQLECRMKIPPRESRTIRFFVAGSCDSYEECQEQERLLRLPVSYERQKRERFQRIFCTCGLESGDDEFDQVFQWIKVHSDWMTLRYDPVGRGITAGLPDFRWWFGCDSFYTIQGLLALGLSGLVKETLQLLLKYSQKINGDGRIIHELMSNEVCPNKGNVQETAQFVTAVWQYYQWTGDRAFAEDAYAYCEKAMRWLEEMDDDKDGFPTGYGLIEISGLNMEMIDCAVYTCQSYDSFARLSDLLGKEEQGREYRKRYQWLREKINQDFWEEQEGLYCDCIATGKIISSVMDSIMGQAEGNPDPDIVKYLEEKLAQAAEGEDREKGWLVNRNSIIDVPMETEIADQEKAIRALDRMYSEEFVGKYGVWLDSLGKHKCMTITTGIMAVAQANYGYADRALALVKKVFSTFSHRNPGCINEYSPDYGCIVQAWTAYSAVVPVVRHFFGIRPDAAKGEILLQPQIPEGWENASLENVPVLDGTISVSFAAEGEAGQIMRVKNTTSAKVQVAESWKGAVVMEEA